MGQARRDAKLMQDQNNLFINLAEQLKLPLVQILHSSQVVEEILTNDQISKTIEDISLSAKSALNLIDGYVLSVELQRNSSLELEPVSLSSVIYDTAEALDGYAKAHGCSLRLELGGKYAPVMAHRRAVIAALTSLGYSFIESVPHSENEKPIVKLSVRRNALGISTGVFSDNQGLSTKLMKQAKKLTGQASQPLAAFDSGSGAGVFIAEALFNSISTNLRVARSDGLQGLAATLLPSRQLNLV